MPAEPGKECGLQEILTELPFNPFLWTLETRDGDPPHQLPTAPRTSQTPYPGRTDLLGIQQMHLRQKMQSFANRSSWRGSGEISNFLQGQQECKSIQSWREIQKYLVRLFTYMSPL